MNPSQIDELRDALRRETQHIQPVGLGAEAVRRRGRRRRNRRHAVVAVGAATCVAGLGVSLVQRGSGTPHSVAVAAAAGTDAPPALAFRTIAGTIGYSAAHFTSAAGVTYELSTAPGIAAASSEGSQAIYSSPDGEHWTTAAQSQPWISDLTERDGVLYAIGTAPGAANAGDVRYRVGVSRDGGNAWSDTDLPFDLTAPSANVTLTRTSAVQIASGQSLTVALLSEQFEPDLGTLVAQQAAGHPNVTTTQTADGYDILDMSACTNLKAGAAEGGDPKAAAAGLHAGAKCTDPPVLGTITWSDLGLSGPGELRRQQLLVSSDGSHWSSVAAPDTGYVQGLVADNDGFLLLAQNQTQPVGNQPTAQTTLLRSTDARRWTPVGTPAGVNVEAIAGDRLIGINASGSIETSNDGGTTWDTADVGAQLPAGSAPASEWEIDAGPLGFAAVVEGGQAQNAAVRGHDYLLFSADGSTWSTTDLSTVGQPADGYPAQVTVGADHVAVDYQSAPTTAGGLEQTTTVLATPKR